ncbi:MAG: helix-turn-helix transcriptional regulator, partial [Planctomycetota bacterium]
MGELRDDVRLLLDVIPFLQRHGGVTSKDLAGLLHCSEQDVQRVLDRILMCGVPPYSPRDYVSVYRDATGRIRAELADHFRRPVAFSAREVACLKLMLQDPLLTAGDDDGKLAAACEGLLRKLDEAAPPRAGAGDAEPLPIHLAAPGTGVRERAAALQRAIRDGKRVRMRHFSTSRYALVERVVSPAQLMRDGDLLYLLGFDHTDRQQLLSFRVDRIESVAVLDEAARPVDRAALDALVQRGPRRPEPGSGGRPQMMVANVSERAAPYMRESFGSRALTPLSDGYRMKIPLTNPDWLLRFMLSWGEDVEIVRPRS